MSDISNKVRGLWSKAQKELLATGKVNVLHIKDLPLSLEEKKEYIKEYAKEVFTKVSENIDGVNSKEGVDATLVALGNFVQEARQIKKG